MPAAKSVFAKVIFIPSRLGTQITDGLIGLNERASTCAEPPTYRTAWE